MPDRVWLVALFTACMIGAELRPIRWLQRDADAGVITVSLAYASALLFLLPGLVGALTLPAASMFADRVLGVPLLKASFNSAMLAIMSAVGVAIIHVTGVNVTAPGSFETTTLLGIVAACAAMYATNSLMVNIVLALASNRPVRTSVTTNFWVSWDTDGILLPLGPILAAVGSLSPSLLPFAMLVTLAVYGSARTAANEQRAASLDPLTGLLNRRRFDMLAEEIVEQAGRSGRRATLAMLDLDGFKDVNDHLGHHAGDQVLLAVADRLRTAVGTDGLVARLGGDEFAIIVETDADTDAGLLANRIAATFTEPICISHNDDTVKLPIRGSVGLCASGPTRSSLGALARAADACMYNAKRTGNPYEIASLDGSQSSTLHDALSEALDTDSFSCVYQPLIDIQTGAVVAFEALARWEDPEHGHIPPDVFIPVAEASSLMGRLTERVLSDSMQTLAMFAEAGAPVAMHVNTSAKNLADPTFPAAVASIVESCDADPTALVIEITETHLMQNHAVANQALQRLRDLGARTALDDFGTGYSSLGHLKDLPLTDVKIDRAFVLDRTDRGRAILQAFVTLATQLGLHTTAEGVEDRAWLVDLQQLGFSSAQGYAIGRPLTRPEALAWLEGRQSLDHQVGGIINLVTEQSSP